MLLSYLIRQTNIRGYTWSEAKTMDKPRVNQLYTKQGQIKTNIIKISK